MIQSILLSVKKVLNLDPEYTPFDEDILMHINSVFSTLNQLGIGPEAGYRIEDNSTEWSALLGADDRLNDVKSYVCLRVRLLFDPPATSFGISSIQEMCKELEWRINTKREMTAWVDPSPVVLDEYDILDGGGV